jgi:hypothetical protein
MARVIVRFSLEHDTGSTVGNRIATDLWKSGIVRKGATGTYEQKGADGNLAAILIALRDDLLRALIERAKQGGEPALDHLWIYVDGHPAPPDDQDDDSAASS